RYRLGQLALRTDDFFERAEALEVHVANRGHQTGRRRRELTETPNRSGFERAHFHNHIAVAHHEIFANVARDPHDRIDAARSCQRWTIELQDVGEHRLRTALPIAAGDAD